MSENVFGIMANRWKVLRRPILQNYHHVLSVVKACVALHNYIRERRPLEDYEIEVSYKNYEKLQFCSYFVLSQKKYIVASFCRKVTRARVLVLRMKKKKDPEMQRTLVCSGTNLPIGLLVTAKFHSNMNTR